jgi:hypothetical protein
MFRTRFGQRLLLEGSKPELLARRLHAATRQQHQQRPIAVFMTSNYHSLFGLGQVMKRWPGPAGTVIGPWLDGAPPGIH